MLQGLEPRALLSASIQVFNGGSQLANGASDNFGTVTVGSSDTQNLTMKNVGDATLTVSSDSLPYGFSSSTSIPLDISPGQSATLSVSMNTNSAGNYGGQLSLSTNDPSNGRFALTLSGTVQQGSSGGTIELFDGSTQLTNGSTDGFPSAAVGSSDSKSFNVQNVGSSTLTVSSMSLPSGYTLNGSLPLNVPPNQSASFTVSLNTSTAGNFSGQMLVSSSDSADNPLAVDISGTVTAPPAPSMSLSEGSTSIANGGSDTFGTVVEGSSATKTFTVSNSGTASLSVSSISLPTDYTLQTSLPLTVAAGGSTTFVVAMGTSATGTFAGQMLMSTNDPYNSQYNVTLSATVNAQAPVIEVYDGQNEVPNDPSGSGSNPDNFGSAYVGTAIQKTFDIANAGSTDISITSGSLSLPSGFSLIGSWPTNVSQHGSTPFTIEFNPTVAGVASGELSFSDSDPGGSVYQFAISATGTVPPPAIAVADGAAQLSNGGSDSFGSAVVGSSVEKSFTLTNTGGQTLTINSANAPSGFVVDSSFPMNVAPGASAVLQVTMQAYSAGSLGGPLTIASNASVNNSFTVGLSGAITGGASVEVFDGSTQLTNGATDSLGDVTVGSTVSKTLTLTNAGGGPLVVNSAGGSSGLYVITSLPLTIPAGQSAQVTIGDYIYAAGSMGGQVVFQTNDPSNTTFAINVTATASGGGSVQLSDNMNQLSTGGTDDFGTVQPGTSWSKTFTVTNTDIGSLTISSVSVPSGFSLDTALPLTVGPYQTASIVVGLNTSTTGTYSGPITITSDDANNPTFTINVTTVVGTSAGSADFDVFDGTTQLPNGNSDTFPTVSAGVVDVKEFSVSIAETSAPSYGAVTINSVDLPSGFYLDTTLPLTAAVGQPTMLDIGVNTSTAASYGGLMTINAASASNGGFSGAYPTDPAGGSYSTTINLSATVTGSQSQLSVLDGGATITNGTGNDSFGTTTVGSPVDKTFVIEDAGPTSVALSNLSLPNGFSLVGSFPSSVPAHGSVTFEVQMDAASAGGASGWLSFNDSEFGGSSYSFIVSGTANQVVYSGPPRISLAATANADEATLTPGTFTLSSNEPGVATNVPYQLSGTAIPGVDYVPPLLATTIPSSSPSSVVTITPIDNGPFNAVRQEVVVPTATGGAYTLSLGDDTTAPLAYNADADTVQAALAALPSVGAGNVSVAGAGTFAQPFVVAWKGSLLNVDVGQLTGDGTNLLGAAAAEVTVNAVARYPASAVEQVGFTAAGITASYGDMVYERQFTLTFDGQTSQPIFCNAMAFTVQSALTALSSIGSGNVTVADDWGAGQKTYLVYFQGALALQNVPPITVNLLPWTWQYAQPDGTPTPIETTIAAGTPGQTASQTVSIYGATGGTFTLALDGAVTAPLVYSADAAAVQTAVAALPNVGAGNVSVTGSNGGPWTITFVGAELDQPVDPLEVDASQLTGGPIQASSLPPISGPLTVTLQMLAGPTVNGVASYVVSDPSSATIQITDGQPAITVSEGGGNIANEGGTANFGNTPFGQSVSETFTITNSGTDTLTLDPTSLSLPTGFSLVGTFPSSVGTGASANFTLQMSAATAGTLSGSVSFTDNDLANTLFTFTVEGSVGQPVPEAALNLFGPGHLTVTPVPDGTGSVNFGQTNQNVPISEDFRIDNLGQAALTLIPSSLILPQGFALMGSFPSSVAPGNSQDFTLEFQATTVGAASGTVSFATNDGANNPYSFTVSGAVNPPAPAIEVFDRGSLLESGVGTVTFTTVTAEAPSPASEALTIANAGMAPLTLDSSSVTLPEGFSVVTPFISPVPAGGSTTMVIQLGNLAAGSYSGTLSFGTNDGAANPYSVMLSGQVLPAPAIKVYDGSTLIPAAGSDEFGAASQGAPLIKDFTIENTGSNTISINSSSLSVPSGFSIATALPSSLPAGASATFAIELTAANIGAWSGSVSFSDTDTGNNPYTFQVSGQVVPPGPTNVTISGLQLANNTSGTASNPVSYDPRVTGIVNGTFASGYVDVEFDDSGSGTPQGSTSHITSSGTSFTYDPRTGDPSLANYSGTVNLHYRIASFNAAGAETDGPWNDYQFTLIPVPVGAHVDHLTLFNDTGTSATDGLTYDPRVTGVVNGPFVGNSAQVDFTIIPSTGSQATGVVSGILFAGQTFTFNPLTADPALAGYAGPLTLKYYAVDLDASGKEVHTGDTLTFTMTMYVPTPQVSISGFGLLDDTDPAAATLSTADPRVTGTLSGVPNGETVSVEFSHHGDGVVNGSAPITPSTLTFTYDPRTAEKDLANYVGPLNLEYRTVEIDTKGGEIDAPWTSYPFNMEQATSPATIQSLTLSDVTISSGPPPVTSDPTLSGTVTGTTISTAPTVQIDTNGDGVPDGSVTAGSNGTFSIVPTNLPYGSVTIDVRAAEYDPKRTIYLYGAWIPISFDYEPPPAPAITTFALASVTGGIVNGSADPSATTDDALQGAIAVPPTGDTVQVEFDTDEDGTANSAVAVSGTSFSFTPDWLPFGQVTVQARTLLSAADGVVLSYGAWTPLTFTYVATPGTPATISSLDLANQTGIDSSNLPTASDPTLTGTVNAASGDAYQAVEYEVNGVAAGTTTTDANGNFTFTPQGLTAGAVTISVRADAWDSPSQSNLEGPWQTITFDYQPIMQQPITVSQFSLGSPLMTAAGADATDVNGLTIATDPTVAGQLAGGSSDAYLTVQFDTNAGSQSPANYAPNASTTADANGAFQFTPTGLPYGTVTVAVRAEYYDYTTDAMAYSAWTPLSFDYEQSVYTPPTIDQFALASDTGGSSNPGQTANPTVTGHVSGDAWAVAGSAPSSAPQSATTFIEFDTTGDGTVAGYAWPDANGNFIYTPKYISYGPVTINARVVYISPAGSQSQGGASSSSFTYGAWTPFSFNYVNEPNTAPVLTSLGLVVAGSPDPATDVSGSPDPTSTDASPIIAGQVTYQGDLSGITIQFDTTGGGTPNGTATTDDYGRFQFTPSGLTPGNVTINARTYAVDDITKQVLVGPWMPFTFTWQPPAPSPLSIGTLTLANGTADASGNLSANDPTVTGTLVAPTVLGGGSGSGSGDVSNQIVQFDTNGDGVPDGSIVTDSAGNFTYTPTALAAGSVTIAARVEDTAGNGTPIYSSWTSLTFKLTPPPETTVGQFVVSNPASVNGATNASLATDPTVSGKITGANISGVTVEFDTTGDGEPTASVTTDANGNFSYKPYVNYGIVTISARTEDWIDGTLMPSAWVTLNYVYASDPTSAAAQTELATLATLATAQSDHDTLLSSSGSDDTTAQTTGAANYHRAEAGAENAYQTTTAPAESNYASQTASAGAGYNTAAASAATNFASSLASFSGDTTSYSLPDGALAGVLGGATPSFPDAPPVPAAGGSYQSTPPIQAPAYTGPAFDVEQDAGYQSDLQIAEGVYNTSIQTATGDYNQAVVAAMDGPDGYNVSVELAEQQRYQALTAAANDYNAATQPAPVDETISSLQVLAEARQALTQASALADQAYTLGMAQAEQNKDDALAKAAWQRAYAVADAESTLTRAVANANAAAFAERAAAEGTPWAQYESQLAANEAAFFAQDVPAQDAMAKGEADAQYSQAKALDQATYDDEQTVADALESAQVNDSLAARQLALNNLGAQSAYSDNLSAALAPLESQLTQIEIETQAAIADASSHIVWAQIDGIPPLWLLELGVVVQVSPTSAYAITPDHPDERAAAAAAGAAMMAAVLTQEFQATHGCQHTLSDAEVDNAVPADDAYLQDAHDYAMAQATAEAGFHQANANADRDAIIGTAKADQVYADLDAGYQGSLAVANALSEQSFEDSVSNDYASRMQAWAASDGSPWATLQAAFASDDAAYTQTIALAEYNHVFATAQASTNWTAANDAADEQQTEDDADAEAASVTAAATAQITAATTVTGAAQDQFHNDVQDLAAFDHSQNGATATVLDALAAPWAALEIYEKMPDPIDSAAPAQAAETTLNPLAASLLEGVADKAAGFAASQAGADQQLNIDEASAAYTLATTQADDARTHAYSEAAADHALAEAQALADQAQTHAQAAAQAGLDLTSSADQQTYNVALASAFASQMDSLAANDDTPLSAYWSAVADAEASQAVANQTAVNNYEFAATAADAKLSDDQGTAEYDYAHTSAGADLLEAQQAADALHAQAYSDAGYTRQAATDAAASAAEESTAAANAQETEANAVASLHGEFTDDWYSAALAEAAAISPMPPPTDSGPVIAAQNAFEATLATDKQALAPQYGDAGIALGQALGDADETLATQTGGQVSNLASELAGDANMEATGEQGAILADAQTSDAAAVTRAQALALAQNNYATTTGAANTAETHAEGLASVAEARDVATAEADYQIGAATADDNAAHAWATGDASARSAFFAAYADADLAWLDDAAPTYVTEQTSDAQADADYADQAAGLDASLTGQTTAEGGSLAVTQAQLYQAEQDAIAGEEQTFALTQTAQYGDDIAARMAALATRDLASAQDGAAFMLAEAQNDKTHAIDFADNVPYPWPPYDNSYPLGEAGANLDWVQSTTQADSGEQTTVASADQTRGDHEADAELSFAEQSADAQWSHDEIVAGEQEANAITLAGDEEAREEGHATNDAALETAEYANAATVMSSLAGNASTPWTQYLAGLGGATSAWWSSNVSAYLGYQNALAGDQYGESVAGANAAQTQADAQADADHTLADAQADADHTQAIDDDAAQQAQQASDAANDRAYQLAIAHAALDYQNLVPDYGAATNAQQNDTVIAQQTYLSSECAAQDSLISANGADALTDSTARANAQLGWTVSGDSATEGYLYSTALADDQQSDLDAQATAGYQAASIASYAAAMQAFDQTNPSPWADYASAMASAQSTLTSTSAGALSAEQIAVADADFAQAWADALAEQGLDDAQATAATNLSIAEQTAESDLSVAQAVFANAVAFQFSTFSQQLPYELQWTPWTPLTAWESAPGGSPQRVRDGVSLPMAWPYQAGDPVAGGFDSSALSDEAYVRQWAPSGLGLGSGVYALFAAPGSIPSGAPFFVGLSPTALDFDVPGTEVDWTELMGWTTNLADEAFSIAGAEFPSADLATFTAGTAPDVFVYADGSLVPFVGIGGALPRLPPPSDFSISGPAYLKTESKLDSFVSAPTPDDAADQDGARQRLVPNPSSNVPDTLFAATPLAQLSDESQSNPDTAPTAAVQEQEVQQTAAADAATANEAALQGAVQTQMARLNVQRVPLKRIDDMVTEGLAFRSSTNADYVYFASIDGDKIVRFVLEKYNVSEMLYSVNGAYYAKVGEAYKVVWEQVMPTAADGALPAAQVLANVNTQQKADAQIDMILARKAEGVQQAIVGTFEFTVNFVGRATPLVGTAMAFAQDGAKEGFISLAGDVAFFATLGASKVATVSATAARNLRITAAGAQGVIGVARSGQAYFAIKAGNYVQAGGYMGEALLRFIGVKKGIVDELKAIQALKSAVPSFVQKIIPNPGIQWGKGIQTQGLPWENYLATQLPPGSRLPTGFKTFDFFDRTSRTAISAKTLDTTTAAKIANPKSVYSSLKRDIDAAADFTKSQRLGRVLEAGDIRVRELQLAVPKGTTAEQWEQINQAIQYAKSKGVALEVNAID